jgi:16S rRNA (guanine527-N7)-methyltransferase
MSPEIIAADWLGARLAEPAAALEVSLEPSELGSLARFAGLLLSWNARIRLTGARTREALADEHLADALSLVAHVPATGRAIDIGAGSGLPGMVLAILRPSLNLTLLEPNAKKVAFLRAARREIESLRIAPVSMEEHQASEAFRPYDLALSRATWPPRQWLERGAQLVRSGGLVLAQAAGSTPDDLPGEPQRFPYRIAGRERAVLVRRV